MMESLSFRVMLLLALCSSLCSASSVIIVEDAKACFRRVLAGKRILRAFVRKAVPCERLEDCQRECSDEKRFVCEGFNYRLDPSGRGQGDCELLDLPLSRFDIRRDVYDDPDYDYYERDRNSDAPDCKGNRYYGSYGSGGHYYSQSDNRYEHYGEHRHGEYYDESRRGSNYGYGHRQLRPSEYDDDYRQYSNHRGDYEYQNNYQSENNYERSHYKHESNYDYEHSSNGYRYQRPTSDFPNDQDYKSRYPPPPYDYKSYEPYLPHGHWKYERPFHDSERHWDKYFEDRLKDKKYWGFRNQHGGWGSYGGSYGNFGAPDSYYANDYYYDGHKNNNRHDVSLYEKKYFYVPHDHHHETKDWGRYGGSYGYDTQKWKYNNHHDGYDYWGFNKLNGREGEYGNRQGEYGNRQGEYGNRQGEYGNRQGEYGNRQGEYGNRQGEYGNRQGEYGNRQGEYGNRQGEYGNRQDEYANRPGEYGNRQGEYGNRQGEYGNRQGEYGNRQGGLLPPYQEKPDLTGTYLPPYDNSYDYFGIQRGYEGREHDHSEHHDHYYHDVHDYHKSLKDECSLRMVTGFRLHKGIVKKLVAVPNIYECELLCFKERDFPCNSYAFKYTTIPNTPPENCYLSDRGYKELDYYTDLEPDRDCDIYRMNNHDRCGQSTFLEKYNSDCFWRVRSGHRLDQRIVRDSLNVKSIVDCQVECLKSSTFTCRSFSFRYGSPVIGGAIDNCQLTDWPFADMDHRTHLVPETGFELYERGSYGHGCEPNHFYIGGKPDQTTEEKLGEICYIGYGSPARLLPQATKKSIRVETEAECKTECTRARDKSLFQCMSLSYRTIAPKGSPNCDLSDIFQRDLLSNVDYVADPNSWLFAWDIHNPRCADSVSGGIGIGGSGGTVSGSGTIGGIVIGEAGGSNVINGDDDVHNAYGKKFLIPWTSPGYTWRIYSVGGLPCKQGSLCQENKVAGFWYCELEGREEHAWDYCCRPDHQCGHSEGFSYQWCYVGAGKTQWRKCNDRYYPYTNIIHDRFDQHHHSGTYLPHHDAQAWASTNSVGSNHIPEAKPPPRPSLRPEKPPPTPPPTTQPPAIDDYDSQTDDQFLDPPKPGGFGQSRHWPLSYLHKEPPPNETLTEPVFKNEKAPKGRNIESKYEAIANLIDAIKSNDLKSLPYQISNNSDNANDVLYVQIPLPTNLSSNSEPEAVNKTRDKEPTSQLEAVDLFTNESASSFNDTNSRSARLLSFSAERRAPTYTKSYITKTNRTSAYNSRLSKRNVESLQNQ